MPFQLLTSLMDIDTLMTKWRCEYAIIPAECGSSVCSTEKKNVNVKGDHLYKKPTPEGRGSGANNRPTFSHCLTN